MLSVISQCRDVLPASFVFEDREADEADNISGGRGMIHLFPVAGACGIFKYTRCGQGLRLALNDGADHRFRTFRGPTLGTVWTIPLL